MKLVPLKIVNGGLNLAGSALEVTRESEARAALRCTWGSDRVQ